MNTKQSHPIQNILQFFQDRNILYVCWKDLDLFTDIFDGKKDLDILVLNEEKNRLIDLAQEFGALILKNRFETSDDLLHLYLTDESGCIFHIHVYTRLVTGESWLKEYHFPIEKKLFEERVWDPIYRIWKISNLLNQELLVLRHLLKITSITSWYTYRNKKKSAMHYISQLKKDPNKEIFVHISRYLDNSNFSLLSGDLNKLNYITAIKFRDRISNYKRLTNVQILFLRFKNIFWRLQKRFVRKEKKFFLKKGVILAFTGVDGSGKSSLLSHTESFYSKILTTKKTHIGRPFPTLVHSVWRILKSKRKTDSTTASKPWTSIFKCTFALLLAKMRLQRARYIYRLANKGNLILVDRWPTAEQGKMDGPRIRFYENSRPIVRFLGGLEQKIYNEFPMADICIFLRVSSLQALERNKNRIKANKETSGEIIKRFSENYEYYPKARLVLEYENSLDLIKAQSDIVIQSWLAISRHNNSLKNP
jgi:thymidylate kinase